MTGGRPAAESSEPVDYLLAGLVVRSAIPLPAPRADAAAAVDVEVAEGVVPSARVVSRPDARVQVGGEEADLTLRWAGVTSMRVEAGRRITVALDDGVSPAAVAPLVLGVGMGLLLHQRGRLVLHASGVALPRGAAAFVGWKGAGKSTAAGALVRRGHPIITDDALPLDIADDGRATAWPGPAPLKLWPESASALGRSPRRLPRLHPKASKRVVADLPRTTTAVPLVALYSLEVADEIRIEPLAGSAALLEVMRHAYAPRFLPSAGATPEHFDRCARLVRGVPVFRLARPAGLDRLDDVARAIEGHVASIGTPAP
jgi:hypothetical protein